MTLTALHTPLTAAEITSNNASSLAYPFQYRSWACNTCHLSFKTGQAQRQHMKSSWHVYNLKRRIALLPPISLDVFEEKVQPDPEPVKTKCTESSTEVTVENTSSMNECLFCPLNFESSTDGLTSKAKHMSHIHGFFIPDQDLLSDLGSFLGYLSTVIRAWHECLYCGITKASTCAIQSHMRDTGHCMLNLEREPELMGFWERRSNMHVNPVNCPTKPDLVFEKAFDLPARKTIGLRKVHLKTIKPTERRNTHQVLRAGHDTFGTQDPSQSKNGRQLTPRNETGIQNVDPQKRRALFSAQKRSQRTEAIANRGKEWSYARRSNDQNYDQEHGKLSWAKGGMHNLLPR